MSIFIIDKLPGSIWSCPLLIHLFIHFPVHPSHQCQTDSDSLPAGHCRTLRTKSTLKLNCHTVTLSVMHFSLDWWKWTGFSQTNILQLFNWLWIEHCTAFIFSQIFVLSDYSLCPKSFLCHSSCSGGQTTQPSSHIDSMPSSALMVHTRQRCWFTYIYCIIHVSLCIGQ